MGGFTLIELLVVIAVIALLIGILLPTLGKARQTARMVKEQAACKEMLNGWFIYNASYKDEVIPGYSNWSWAHPHTGKVDMMPPDPADRSKRMEGDVIKSWPWRFVALTSFPVSEMMNNRDWLTQFRARDQSATGGSGTNLYDDVARFQYALACHSSFGMNSVYVGGHYLLSAFGSGSGSGDGVAGTLGKFWISRVDEVRKPSKLIVFATSRQQDVKFTTAGRSGCGYTGMTVPFVSAVQQVPGASHIFAPKAGVPQTVSAGTAPINWPTVGASATASLEPYNDRDFSGKWGNIHPRHFKKAIVGTVDGHAELTGLEDLRDMQRWANKAKNKDDVGTNPRG